MTDTASESERQAERPNPEPMPQPEYVQNTDAFREYQDAEGTVVGGDTLIVQHLTRHPGMCMVTKRVDDPRGFVDTQTRYVGAPDPNVFLSVSYIMSVAQKIAGIPSKKEYEEMLTELDELRAYKVRTEPMVASVEAYKAQSVEAATPRARAKK
jgi:hypothetical protein